MTLYQITLKYLKERSILLTFSEIEKQTGISQAWLNKFISGQIKDPSVNKIQKLYEYLAKTSLKVK